MFETTSGIVVGRSHALRGLPCQDAIATASNTHGLVVALADGVGSAACSEIGSNTAVPIAVTTALQGLGQQSPAAIVSRAAAAAAEAVAADADALGSRSSELATTLSIAVVGYASGEIAVGASGDGIHVVRDRSGTLHLVADQAPAPHANTVSALCLGVEPRVAVLPIGGVDAVLLSSDGLEHLLLRRPADRRWPQPLLSHELMDGVAGASDLLLRDPILRAQTDDDCSVVVIRRNREEAGERVRLADGQRLTIGPPERLNDLRIRRVLDRPGLSLVPLAQPVDSRWPDIIGAAPERIWPTSCAWPLIAWPEGVAIRDDGSPGGLVIRHPGIPCDAPADLRDRIDALTTLIDLLHENNLAHGHLTPQSFLPAPAVDFPGES